jgi:hypothetical protein
MTASQANLKLDFAAIRSNADWSRANEPTPPTKTLRTNRLNLTFADLNYRIRNGFFSRGASTHYY